MSTKTMERLRSASVSVPSATKNSLLAKSVLNRARNSASFASHGHAAAAANQSMYEEEFYAGYCSLSTPASVTLYYGTATVSLLPPPSSAPVSKGHSATTVHGCKTCSSCTCKISPGTNVVAIDNRIEQAMDLVKTHLMYAVREEVESLKEKIGDLERKVSRLERENQILREHASPEILAQIQQAIVAAGGGQSSVLPQLAGFAPPPAILQTPPAASPFLHQQAAPPVPVVVTKEP